MRSLCWIGMISTAFPFGNEEQNSMNKLIAERIAEEKLQAYMKKEPQIIKALLTESDHEFITKDGVEYQLRVDAFYNNKKLKQVTITVAVDDQKFWSTFAPLCKSDYYYLNG